MLEEESVLAAETARAMRELASTVTDAPPLRLAPRAGARVPRRSRRRGWTRWAVPLAAAVAVIALAVSLVLIKDLPKGHAAHPVRPAYPTAAPRYYVAPEASCAQKCDPTRLVVGDTYTGARLATLTPPAGTTFGTVSGAANDRTFVTDTVGYPVSFTSIGLTAAVQHVTWYRITISPGSSSPVRLTRLPIPATPTAANLAMVALSASGRELAMVYHLGSQTSGSSVLRIYSLASGQLLRSWSTDRQVELGALEFIQGEQTNDELSWVNDDRAVTFPATTFTPDKQGGLDLTGTTVRVLDLAARGHDLVADSRAVWPPPKYHPANSGTACQDGTAPSLAANGTTIVCIGSFSTVAGTGNNAPVRWRETWLTYPIAAPEAVRVRYQITALSPANGSAPNGDVLWADPSGSTLIIAWARGIGNGGRAHQVVHYGLVSQGKFIPLPSPPDEANLIEMSPGIAW